MSGIGAVGVELDGLVDIETGLVGTPMVVSGEASTVDDAIVDVDSVVVDNVKAGSVEVGLVDVETSKAVVAELNVVGAVTVRPRSRPISVEVMLSDGAVAASMGSNSSVMLSDMRCILFFVPTPSP